MNFELTKQGLSLFHYLDGTQSLWHSLFRENVRCTWDNPPKTVEHLVDSLQRILNDGAGRNGQVSLFIREPLSDRLILTATTVPELRPGAADVPPEHLFKERKANYDPMRKVAFYQLCDTLTREDLKKSLESRRTRGLTGWVAVTGLPLRVNNEFAKELLEQIAYQSPEAARKCDKYGSPIWARRITEFIPTKPLDKWTKRVLAVPIPAVNDPKRTIGVLRYTCLKEDPELTRLDLWCIAEAARLYAAVQGLQHVRTLSTRENTFAEEELRLQTTGNLRRFLQFIAQSLRSEIASVYICIRRNGRMTLRLFDAHGIEEQVAQLREDTTLHDYNESTGGLTWELFTNRRTRPIAYDTVLDCPIWEGLNAKIFYGRAFDAIGLSEAAQRLEKPDEHRALLETYRIALIGHVLVYENSPVGVLKVEFPSTFDTSAHYKKEDQDFFLRASKTLAKHIGPLSKLLDGTWFMRSGPDNVHQFALMLNELIRVGLLNRDDLEKRSDIRTFADSNRDALASANEQLFQHIPREEAGSLLRELWDKVPDWLKAILFTEGLRRIFGLG